MTAHLPETYTNVPHVALVRKDPPIPKQVGPNSGRHSTPGGETRT